MNANNSPSRAKRPWTKFVVAFVVLAILIGVGIVVGVRQVYQSNLRPVASDQKTMTVLRANGR